MKNSMVNNLARCGLALALCASLVAPAQAQAPAGNAGVSATKASAMPGGVILEGNVIIDVPDLNVRAHRVEMKQKGNEIQEVKAQKDVNFKVNLASRSTGKPVRIEATCDAATLDPIVRKLTMRGKVDGWYESAEMGRTKINSEMVVLYFRGESMMADLSGGVRIDVPTQATAGVGEIGSVTVTSRDASLDQAKGIARFSGNAHAVSADTPNKFDVSAPEFVLTRSADGKDLHTITATGSPSTGRVKVKMDLPPEMEAAAPAATVTATVAGAEEPKKNQISRPTHVEVEADSATVTRATNTLVFAGNVKGFYELAPAGAATTRYDFVSERATINYVQPDPKMPEKTVGLYVDIDKVNIAFPTFDFGLKNKK